MESPSKKLFSNFFKIEKLLLFWKVGNAIVWLISFFLQSKHLQLDKQMIYALSFKFKAFSKFH